MLQVDTAINLIGKIAKDYIRLLKYGDSLYRCKCLKVAALGRMCTVIKRIGPSLTYLEQVRKHLARLPSIDILVNDEWKEDIISEIIDDHNVADFMDPGILERLEEIEREEGVRLAGEEGDEFKIDGDDMIPEEKEALNEIRKRKKANM
jgi:NOG1 N-terminal helical domain/NOGCT (NUC087) domain